MIVSESQTDLVSGGLIVTNQQKALYYRGQATKARMKSLKWVLRSIGRKASRPMVYFVLKRLRGE